jgi:DNA-binding NtrC family response regulator
MKAVSAGTILVADDNEEILEAVDLLLGGNGYRALLASSAIEAWEVLEASDPDLVLMDLNYRRQDTSGKEGLDLLQRIAQRDDAPPIIVLTAFGNVELAVQAMRSGAADFVEKPWDNQRLLNLIKTQLELKRARDETRRLETMVEVVSRKRRSPLIAESPSMQRVLQLIEQTASSSANVLLTGEPGVGKSLLARRIHALSERAEHQLITVNLGGMTEGLFESEMFGHARGAFTGAAGERIGRFELAHGSTLFLDEIANISASQQAALLRVLEEGEFERVGASRTRKVDVRIVSATNSELEAEMEVGRFRRDLYYRLKTIHLEIPPLRQRKEDLLPLSEHFLSLHTDRHRRPARQLSREAEKAILAYPWPGNVRELGHCLERAVLVATDTAISTENLALVSRASGSFDIESLTLEESEKYLLRAALDRNAGSMKAVARELDLSRSALYRRLVRHGLMKSDGEADDEEA